MSDDRCDELRRFERNYPGSVPFTTPSQAEKIFEQRMEAEIERNRAKNGNTAVTWKEETK